MIHLKCHPSGKHCISHLCEHNSYTECSQDTLEVSECLTMRRERHAEFLSWHLPLRFKLKWITPYVPYIRLAKCTIWFSAKNGSVHLRFIKNQMSPWVCYIWRSPMANYTYNKMASILCCRRPHSFWTLYVLYSDPFQTRHKYRILQFRSQYSQNIKFPPLLWVHIWVLHSDAAIRTRFKNGSPCRYIYMCFLCSALRLYHYLYFLFHWINRSTLKRWC
jgi:hypothetical protein